MDNRHAPSYVIIKKQNKHTPHHGGSWKIAYADFVTAMMAFFMLMWLLNIASDEVKKGIADYFSPNFVDMKAQGGGESCFGGANMSGTNTSDNEGSLTTTFDDTTIISPDGSDKTSKEPKAAQYWNIVPPQATRANIPSGPRPKGQDRPQTNPLFTELENLKYAKSPKKDKKLIEKSKTDSAKTATFKGNAKKDLSQPSAQTAELSQKIVKEIKKELGKNPDLKNISSQLLMEVRPEGVRIQMVDAEKESMFPLGSYQPLLRTIRILQIISQTLKTIPNRISIEGHTDAKPYIHTNDYSNWELSSDRAHACRRYLTAFGIDKNRFESVIGREATQPLVPNNPKDPRNRRITINVLT